MGLAPQVVEEIFEIVQGLNEREGVSFLLAEQNTNIALRYASFGYILETGRVVLDGAAEALRDNEDVREFYLGVAGEDRRSFRERQDLQAPQALAGVRVTEIDDRRRPIRAPCASRLGDAARTQPRARPPARRRRHLRAARPADLALIPVLRKSDARRDAARRAAVRRPRRRADEPPSCACSPRPGGIYEPESPARDPWGAAKAFAAAGVAARRYRGQLLLLSPDARAAGSSRAARMALGCPRHPRRPRQHRAADRRDRASAGRASIAGRPTSSRSCSTRRAAAGADVSSLARRWSPARRCRASLARRARRRGRPHAAGLRHRRSRRRSPRRPTTPTARSARACWSTTDLFVEIVTPGTTTPRRAGKVGEVVVTRLAGDYPLLRFATGDLSAWAAPGRLKGWMGRADQSAKVKGLFVHPGQVVEIGKRHRELGALRLVVTREGEQDAMTLHAETAAPSDGARRRRRARRCRR